MFGLAAVSWAVGSMLWPPTAHRNWVIALSASALAVWVALLEVRRVRVVWCWVLVAVWIAQVSVLVWSGLGSTFSLSATAFYVPVGVFAAVFFQFRTVALCQGAIAGCLWLVRMGPYGVGRAAFAAVIGAVCLSTAPFTIILFNKSIRRLGMVDPETGLPNGLGMAQGLDEREDAVALAVVSVLVRGIDTAREALGYQAGTELLRRAIEDIGQVLPPDTTIGRISADELVITQSLSGITVDPTNLSPGIPTDAVGAVATLAGIVERSIEAGRYAVDGVEVALRAYAGASIAPWDGIDSRELLRRASLSAEQALAEAVPFVMWIANSRTLTAEDLAMLADLGMAAERGELELVFQPQMDSRSGSVVGAEALLRWHSPTHGLVSPGLFIPLAERIGLIDRLTEWILPTALDAQADWRRQGLTVPTSVNI
jgi:GGDEF domain-containing protein